MKYCIIALFLCLFSGFSSQAEKEVVVPKLKPQNVVDQLSFTHINLKRVLKEVHQKHKAFSFQALQEAFLLLDKNKVALQSEGLCLNKDNSRNRKKIRNQECLVVADYTKSKKTPRLLVINPKTGESELFFTAHGKGSHSPDKIETGHLAQRFSNRSGSNMTSLGFYLTDNIYNSRKSTFGPGPANGLKLDGLNCTNNNARMRYIVMHTADYVQPLSGDPEKIGNSEGCVTLPEHRKDILQKCKNGALVYAYSEKKAK